mgnify:CR=1 FL=1
MPWQYDTNLSQVLWSTTYLGIATVHGKFTDVQASVDLDAADPVDWRADVIIQTASIWSGFEAMDEHLRSPAYLDAAHCPTIEFHSSAVEPLPSGQAQLATEKAAGVVTWEPHADHFRVRGTLTLRGITRPAELDTWYFGQATDGRGATRRALRAQTSVPRADFAIYKPPHADAAREVAGEVVDITIEVIANQVNGDL